ncbi:MAG: hypothetical protein V8R83_11750 [Candidatus Gastranaerophilaceae bacterium]|jgi:hypothetical protein
MDKFLICYITDNNDFDYIDSRLEYFAEQKLHQGCSVVYKYVAQQTKNGFTQTDIEEISYILESNRGINYILFVVPKDAFEVYRSAIRNYVDKGYIVTLELEIL